MSETDRTHYFYFYYREKASEKRLKNRRATCDKVKFRVDANIFKLSKFIGLGFEVTNDSRAKEARRKTERDGNGGGAWKGRIREDEAEEL